MPFDMTGGYDPAFDYPLAERPDNPELRDSVSMWISDNAGNFGFPRICIEAVAGEWDNRGVQANIAFPDGRVLIGAGGYGVAPEKRVDGRAVTLNAGPVTFEVVEPLRRWRMTYDGAACELTVADQARGLADGPRRKVLIELDAVMAAPPWTPGEKAAQSGDAATAKAVGAVGGHRHEQLFRCSGRFAVEGEEERRFEGTGLRIRRTGERDVGEFPGHCWMSALFPSGKAFGILAFPPRADGTPAYSEAFLFDGAAKRYGRVVEAPWLTRFEPHGGACDLLLEMDDGEQVRIGGCTHNATFVAKGVPLFWDWNYGGGPHGVPLPFHQGDALYTMGGESAYGMIERSLPLEHWEA
ncbi:MAG: hypothetical protein M0R03_06950 [Novosphingobium sp.]|nr:hypothetical protein [Novosphingobium sp.]